MPEATTNRRKTPKAPEPIDANRSYTTAQLCAAAQISRWTLLRWRKQGLQANDTGRQSRYLGRDVIEFLHGQRTTTPTDNRNV